MKPHPLYNALASLGYIIVVISFLRWVESFKANTPDTFIDGVGFLSLFTFSGAVMAFLFFYVPVVELIAGRQKAAFRYFLLTLTYFGVLTAIILTLVLWH